MFKRIVVGGDEHEGGRAAIALAGQEGGREPAAVVNR